MFHILNILIKTFMVTGKHILCHKGSSVTEMGILLPT